MGRAGHGRAGDGRLDRIQGDSARRSTGNKIQLYEFGKLPVVYQGRVKPLDTLARNSLSIISNKQTFADEEETKQPAIRWLLDLIARPEVAKHAVFRIEHPEVLDAMGLERRKGLRYSFAELEPRLNELQKQADLARPWIPGFERLSKENSGVGE